MLTCSPDPITNSKTTNTEVHEFKMNQISIDGNKIVNKQNLKNLFELNKKIREN